MSVPGKPQGKKLNVTPRDHRPRKVETRLTEDEFAKLLAFAKITHISMADIQREALNKHLAPPKPAVLPKLPPPPKPVAHPKPKLLPWEVAR